MVCRVFRHKNGRVEGLEPPTPGFGVIKI